MIPIFLLLVMCGTIKMYPTSDERTENNDHHRVSRQTLYPNPRENQLRDFGPPGNQGRDFDGGNAVSNSFHRGPPTNFVFNDPINMGQQFPGNNFPRDLLNRRPVSSNVGIDNFNINDYFLQHPATQRPRVTPPQPGMATTMSPCEQACQTTSQFDPLCGDNGVTYDNVARFRCAVNCGRNIRILRSGACPRNPTR